MEDNKMERTKAIVSAVVVLVVNVAALLGYSLDVDVTQQVILVFVMLAATGWAIWKNHNFTDAAAEAQRYLDDLKDSEW